MTVGSSSPVASRPTLRVGAGGSSPRIMVTGASGFIGRACIKLLADEGWEVHAVSRRPHFAQSSVSWHCCDIRNASAMRSLLVKVRATHLLHLAWCTEPGTFWHSPENKEWLLASISLFDAFANAGGQRIVGTGSCAEYEWSDLACREFATPCRPSTLYGSTKLATGRYLESLGRAGLSTAWARLFFLYGPGASASRMPGVVIQSLSRGETARCSTGFQRRDFLYVDDAARGIIQLVTSLISGPVNICSGVAASIAAIAEKTAHLMGRPELLELGAIAAPPNDPPVIVGDNSRLRLELGWEPKLDLDEGLRVTIAGEIRSPGRPHVGRRPSA